MRPAMLFTLGLLMISAACSDDGGEKNKPVNDPCENNTDCADEICHLGYCGARNPLENGAECSGPGQCRSYHCEGGKCVAGSSPLGQRCRNDDECNSRRCAEGICARAGDDDAGVDGGIADALLRDFSSDAEAACAAVNGSCVGIGDCGKGTGHGSNVSCAEAYLICCIPDGSCGGPEDFVCCSTTATFRPVCVDGHLECDAGKTKTPGSSCP